jgi:predicted metal-dependent phosphoesterase TrpH
LGCDVSGRIDLHVHTTASDGTLSPTEIVQLARERNIRAISITDHDTTDGTRQILNRGLPREIGFITGVEISASRPTSHPGPGSFHILGYGFAVDDPALQQRLRMLQKARRDRNPQIVERLRSLGVDISMEQVMERVDAGVQVGRPHIASFLVEAGVVDSIDAAFDRFLGTGKPAYVDKERVSCEAAMQLIRNAGGVPVIAHPGLLRPDPGDATEGLLLELKEMGCRGVEVYYPLHTREQTQRFLSLARRHELLVTGGTDFHGGISPDIQLGSGRGGNFHVPYALFDALLSVSSPRSFHIPKPPGN